MIDILDVKRLSSSEREEALSFSGSFHDAVRTRNSVLLRGVIAIRGSHALSRSIALIHHAVTEGSIDCIDLLLHAGISVNAIDTVYSRVTPLMEAVRKRNLNVVHFLLERGADIRQVDQCGDNVFHWAARYTNAVFFKNMIKIIKQVHQLIQYDEDGVEIIPDSPRSPRSKDTGDASNQMNDSGNGSKKKKKKKTKGLLQHEDELRVIVNAKNLKGNTPSDIAKSSFISAYLDKYVQPIIPKNTKGNRKGVSTESPRSLASSSVSKGSLT